MARELRDGTAVRTNEGPALLHTLEHPRSHLCPPSCAHSTPRSQSDSSAFRFESVNRVAAVVSCKALRCSATDWVAVLCIESVTLARAGVCLLAGSSAGQR